MSSGGASTISCTFFLRESCCKQDGQFPLAFGRTNGFQHLRRRGRWFAGDSEESSLDASSVTVTMSINNTSTPLLGQQSSVYSSRSSFASTRSGPEVGNSISRTFSIGHADEDGAEALPSETHKNALGTFNGCFIPCCLNIMGVILFLKIGWGIGTAGVVGMLLIFLIAEVLCVLTVLSLSAIITNGDMAGGGSYYMISRSLGPEFGGAIGILFYVAYAFGASFYFIGFAEGVALLAPVQQFICEGDTETGCISVDNFNRIVGFVALAICFGTAWGGAEVFENAGFWAARSVLVLIIIVAFLCAGLHEG